MFFLEGANLDMGMFWKPLVMHVHTTSIRVPPPGWLFHKFKIPKVFQHFLWLGVFILQKWHQSAWWRHLWCKQIHLVSPHSKSYFNNCDAIKQNESEVENVCFCFLWHFLLEYYFSFNLAKTRWRLSNWFLRKKRFEWLQKQ